MKNSIILKYPILLIFKTCIACKFQTIDLKNYRCLWKMNLTMHYKFIVWGVIGYRRYHSPNFSTDLLSFNHLCLQLPRIRMFDEWWKFGKIFWQLASYLVTNCSCSILQFVRCFPNRYNIMCINLNTVYINTLVAITFFLVGFLIISNYEHTYIYGQYQCSSQNKWAIYNSHHNLLKKNQHYQRIWY